MICGKYTINILQSPFIFAETIGGKRNFPASGGASFVKGFIFVADGGGRTSYKITET